MESRRWDFCVKGEFMRLLDETPIYYVYEHYKPNCNEPFWVGKGKKKRAYENHSRNRWWKSIVNKHGFKVRFVAKNLTELDAFWLENVCIIGWGRKNKGEGPLVNLTDGGEGMSGNTHTIERKKKASDRMKGIKNPMFGKCGKENSMFGKKHDAETKAAISKNHTDVSGKNNPMYGKHHKKITKNKISTANKGRSVGNTYAKGYRFNKEQRQHFSDIRKGIPKSKSHRLSLIKNLQKARAVMKLKRASKEP